MTATASAQSATAAAGPVGRMSGLPFHPLIRREVLVPAGLEATGAGGQRPMARR